MVGSDFCLLCEYYWRISRCCFRDPLTRKQLVQKADERRFVERSLRNVEETGMYTTCRLSSIPWKL